MAEHGEKATGGAAMTSATEGALPAPTRDLARLTADMDAFGYCLVAEALPPGKVAAVRARLEAQAAAERAQGHRRLSQVQDSAGANQWVNILLNKGRVFQDLLFDPLIDGVVEHLLGPGSLLSDISAHITRPGNTLLGLHIDQWWLPPPVMPGERHTRPGAVTRENVRTGPPEASKTPINPPAVVNAMWMMSDFTEANGATRIVPGSHLSGTQPDPSVPHPIPTVAVTGVAGTCAIWEGRTWHSAGANGSDEERYGLITYYGGPQYRSLQNHALGTRPEVLEDASPELLALLGFKIWNEYGKTGKVDSDYAHPGAELIGALEP